MKSLCFFFISVTLFISLHASVELDSSLPDAIRSELEIFCKESLLLNNFKVEFKDGFFLIVSDDGYIRRVPASKAEARDLFNILETMNEEIALLREVKKKRGRKE